MKKVRILMFCCILLLVGCTNGIEKNTSKQNKDVAKWSKPRTNLFSSLDYPELSKTEAEKLMEEKFELVIPSFFEQSLALTQKFLRIENQVQYSIKSDAEILTIRGVMTGKEDKSPNSVGLAEAQFQVNQQRKQVYLTKQSILIQNIAAGNALQGDSIRSLVKRVGEAMELPDLDQVMKQSEKKMAHEKNEGPNQLLEIYNDSETAKKQQRASRILTISYDEKHLVKEIYGLISIE